jgi:parallel beta-helix repeat protein
MGHTNETFSINAEPMKTKYVIQLVCALSLSVFNSQFSACHAQGSLTPTSLPGATMLTLSQVEPRTPVDAVHTPGNSSAEFVITNAGSYYLTTNILGVSSKDGIDIYTNNVTLDLNGFSLLGPVANGADGIRIYSGTTNVMVHNGAISSWGEGGILSGANNGVFDHLAVSGNLSGFTAQNVSVIRDCAANGNQENGIAIIANDCLISGNVCNGNNIADISPDGGIVVLGANNRIENNQVMGNGDYGIYIEAIIGGTNNIIVGNEVQGDGANDYFCSTSQIVGPIMTNNPTGVITNSNPWANFQF